MASRGSLTLPAGEIADIEQAARVASTSVAHLHTPIDRRTRPCGHRVTTACTDTICTIVIPCVSA